MADDEEHQAHPQKVCDMMIVPRPTTKSGKITRPIPQSANLSLFDENWVFAQQWKEHLKGAGDVVELKVDPTAEEIFRAFDQAAAGAEKHDVILFVGHGHGDDHPVFDLAPESGGFSTHKHLIDDDVLTLDQRAHRDPQGKWVVTVDPSKPRPPDLAERQKKVDALGPRRDLLERIGGSLKGQGVNSLMILSCSMGKQIQPLGGETARQLLANVIDLPVVCFKGKVVTQQQPIRSGAREVLAVEIWVADDEKNVEKDRPLPPKGPDGTVPRVFPEGHFAFRDIPTDRRGGASPRPKGP